MNKERPAFRKPKGPQTYSSAEELFTKLPNRAGSHGYLRGPQADALRDYDRLQSESDIAFELPTGTGKTVVGLLIAEWRRRLHGEKVAYLTLTNQLAKQVLKEAEKLGIDCADMTGSKDTRAAGEVGRYKAALAIGETTYSNLFNVNPVVQASDLIVFDDAHGGEQFVAAMWTARIRAREFRTIYDEILTILRPGLSDSQYQIITNESEFGSVELASVNDQKAILQEIVKLLDSVTESSIHFPWSLIRNRLEACLIFVSFHEIVVRPLGAPTHTHEPFSESNQRIYLSATLGGEGDLLRSYGITSIKPIRVQHPQWGKRYIFMPGLFLDETECSDIIADIWREMDTRRALILTPSFSIAQKTFADITSEMTPTPRRLGASDIEESLEPFTSADNSILCLAGRYDGLDLPGDNCRLLILAESPAAVGALERHLREHWKLGPLLRRRERVRLIQGMGRCTRDATDYAIIFLIGQSLINSLTTTLLVNGLPVEIKRELKWGLEQSEVVRKDKKAMSQMVIGLLTDKTYRKDANESIEEIELPPLVMDSESYDELGKLEVKYAKALWEGNYSTAYKIARDAADEISEPELAGYRAWWFYLATVSASHLEDQPGKLDCLKRARAAGINTGFLDYLLRDLMKKDTVQATPSSEDIQAEKIWNLLEEWGWQGPKFGKKLSEIKEDVVALSNSTRYHMGLEGLGKCLGAEVIRPTEKGAPDVVWIFSDDCFTFEAKSEKMPEGSLAKRDILQANGHPDWVKAQRKSLKDIPIHPLIISPTSRLDVTAKPHVRQLYFVSTDSIVTFTEKVLSELRENRTRFAGKEYGTVFSEFKTNLRQAGRTYKDIKAFLCKVSL